MDGSCNLRFSHGREEWLIPLSVVAHSLYQVQDPVTKFYAMDMQRAEPKQLQVKAVV